MGKERKEHIWEREKGTRRGKRERKTQGKARNEKIGETEKGKNTRKVGQGDNLRKENLYKYEKGRKVPVQIGEREKGMSTKMRKGAMYK